MYRTFITGSDVASFRRKELAERRERTPDMAELRQKESVLVFVYGTLKKGFHNHCVINPDAKYLGRAFTYRPHFKMLDTGSFPVVRRDTDNGSVIYGELYAVKPINMIRLDGLEGNGEMYQRELVQCKLLDQELHSEVVRGKIHPLRMAWMYIGTDYYWGNRSLEVIQPKEMEDNMPKGVSFVR